MLRGRERKNKERQRVIEKTDLRVNNTHSSSSGFKRETCLNGLNICIYKGQNIHVPHFSIFLCHLLYRP